jgi:hypothetical protein
MCMDLSNNLDNHWLSGFSDAFKLK